MRLVRKVRKNKSQRSVDPLHRLKKIKSKKNKLKKERPDPVEFVTFTFSVDELFPDDDDSHDLDVAADDLEMIMFVDEWLLNETSSFHPDHDGHVSVADALFSEMSLNDESPPTIVGDELDEEESINAFMACLDQWISSSGPTD